jgi:hypothetical protein
MGLKHIKSRCISANSSLKRENQQVKPTKDWSLYHSFLMNHNSECVVMQSEPEQIQARTPTRDDPFNSDHLSSQPSMRKNRSFDSTQHASVKSSRVSELPVTAEDTSAFSSFTPTDREVSHEPRTEPPVPPVPGARRAEIMEYMKQQLDCFGKEVLLRNRFQLLGPAHRATGGAFCV